MIRRLLLALLLLPALAAGALAVQPDEILRDPALEARAREISKELRCLVCQNQSIDDSNAPLARDLRVIVRERLVAGDGDREVLDFVTRRYGDFVLLRPPFKASTLVLWLGPAAILLVGGIGALVFLRGRGRSAAGAELAGEGAPLSADEQARLARLLGREGR
jgi:cytochrome c-type biogenesis protein CcmH